MATTSQSDSTLPPAGPQAGASGSRAKVVQYDEYIDSQLRKTRGHVRSVDLTGSLMALVAGTLGFILLAALVDHWVISGGLGFWGRMLFLAAYIGGALYYLITQIVPLITRSINPLYAAQTIERSQPALKNGLINFLLFRQQPTAVSPVVLEAIEEQAATSLARSEVETAVDRTRLIRTGYVLAGTLLLCALYALLSPKDMFRTIGRVALPWSDLSVPTQATIDEVEPGDTLAFRGQEVTVTAHVTGHGDGSVMLYYTSADGQTVDRAVEMTLPADGYKHTCTLPAGGATLQQNLTYRITAGDAVTRDYRIEVAQAPTIVVQSVTYKYPAYTGLLEQRVERLGDIKAIEGTQVTIEALANQAIESASIDFNCDERNDQRMQATGEQARASFVLALTEDRQGPQYRNYQLLFKNQQGRQNPQPVRHQIDVTRDLAPEIQLVLPKQDDIDLPANESVELEVVANDPDFALRKVTLLATADKKPVLEEALLDEVRRGQFTRKFRFSPGKLGLKAGDQVEYWAAAIDNKDPKPNRSETDRRRIHIVSPTGGRGKGDQLAQNDAKGKRGEKSDDDAGATGGKDKQTREDDKPGEEKAGEQQNPTKEEGKKQRGEEQPKPQEGKQEPSNEEGQQGGGANSKGERGEGKEQSSSDAGGESEGDEQGVASDGSNDGDAIEKILKDRQKQEQQQKLGEKGSESSDEKQQGGEGQDGEQGGEGEQSAENKSDAKKPAGGQGKSGGEKGEKKDAEQPKDKSGSDANQGEGDEKSADQPSNDGGKGGAGKKADEKQDGKQPDSKKSPSGKGAGGQTKESDEQSEQPAQDDPSQGGGKGKGKRSESTDDASSGDEATEDNADGQPQGKGKSTDKPAGTKNPQRTDEKGAGQGQKAPEDGRDPPKDDAPREEGGDGQTKGKKSGDKSDKSKSPKGSSGKSDSGDKNDAGENGEPKSGDQQPQGDAKDGEKPEQADGKGGEQQPSREKSDKGKDKGKDKNADQKPSAGDQSDKGEGGAGQKGEDTSGSPSPQGQNKPGEKSPKQSPEEKQEKPNDSAQSPSGSDKESDSEGADDGDRSGGGKKGGGQKAPKSGTGSDGQSTPADQGSGRSDEPGKQETSDHAGGDQKADGKTGQSGDSKGPGSKTKPTDKPQGKSGEGEQNEKGAGDKPSQPSGKPSEQPGKPGDNPSGGKPGGNQQGTEKWEPGQQGADEANLEYSRKATDLALQHLKDQLRKNPGDPELLKKLGWTRDEAKQFIQRWETMRKQAQTPDARGAQARRELDETLKSLGLRPKASTLQGNAARTDKSQGYKESRKSTPPPQYIEQYKAYTQGTARGEKK